MIVAAGLWLLILGYALVYTGAAYFVNSATAPTLAQALGMQPSSPLLAAPSPVQLAPSSGQPQANPQTASNLT